ncbi:hypothetical protein VIBNISOn1_p0164 [Vibrio nigripulchritudo SOn1]|uniref:Uncharacterized protein n=1 Tax=Vibrio nigripulchritudo SOn1 TaxID=1238450 RepID=A0AAV2W0C1_9VIBR|nr:hypothetical protein VIBNISOn1_p0164 [Vibrio nigripulchritudo SOn1]
MSGISKLLQNIDGQLSILYYSLIESIYYFTFAPVCSKPSVQRFFFDKRD